MSAWLGSISDNYKYDLILADPPFFKDDIHVVVKNVYENKLLLDNGKMLVERSIQTKKADEESFGFEAFKRLGDSLIYLFENGEASKF